MNSDRIADLSHFHTAILNNKWSNRGAISVPRWIIWCVCVPCFYILHLHPGVAATAAKAVKIREVAAATMCTFPALYNLLVLSWRPINIVACLTFGYIPLANNRLTTLLEKALQLTVHTAFLEKLRNSRWTNWQQYSSRQLYKHGYYKEPNFPD